MSPRLHVLSQRGSSGVRFISLYLRPVELHTPRLPVIATQTRSDVYAFPLGPLWGEEQRCYVYLRRVF